MARPGPYYYWYHWHRCSGLCGYLEWWPVFVKTIYYKPGNSVATGSCSIFETAKYKVRIAFLTILSAALLAACNPVKQVLKNQDQFEKIGNLWAEKNPCANDSTIIYTLGETDTIWPGVLPPIYDTIFLNGGDANEPCANLVKKAFKTGYEKAKTQFLKQPVIFKTVDTIKVYVRDTRTDNAVTFNNVELQQQLADCQVLRSKDLGRLWLAWGVAGIAILLLLLCVYLLLKK